MTADEIPPTYRVSRWLTTTNHKDVGILYIITSLGFLLLAGMLAMLIRMQLWTPGPGILSRMAYNEAVTAHGLLMVFWFLSPFAIGFANYIVPLQIGAKDLAFPRLNALSYWLYLNSGLLFIISFFQRGTIDAGWTLYAPLNVPAYTPNIGGTTAILALTLFTISVTIGTFNFLVTIHRMKAEGMGLWNLPLFTWSILLTIWMMLFAFAALLAALIILSADRIVGTVYFSAAEGGSLLWAHLFWFFGHPEVYIVFFPALGIMFECFQTFCGRRIVGRRWVIAAMVLVAVQSFLVWMHHMFLTTINLEIKTLMMATTIGISLPFDLMVFAMIYTMVKGRVQFTTPFLFTLGALVLFIIGGITGVFLGAIVLDYEFRGTYWVVAHFHYVMVSGVTALIGGLYYWFPKMTGRMYNEFLGKVHFAIYFISFNLLYFPLFIAWETPRRVFDYAPGFTGWHQVATVGGVILAASFLIMFYNLIMSYWTGPTVSGNPWDYARTAEWAIPSPPPIENWDGRATYRSGVLEFVHDEPHGAAVADGGAVADAHHSGHEEGHHEPHPDHTSIWPFLISIGAFIGLLGLSGFQGAEINGLIYPILLIGGGLFFAYSVIHFGLESFEAPEPVIGERWPFNGVNNEKLGVWFFLASDVVVFGAFLGAFVFMRVAMGWDAWGDPIPVTPLPGLINTFILLTSSFTVILALVYAERENTTGLVASLSATVILGLTFLTIKAWEWDLKYAEGITVGSSIQSSVFYLTTSLHGLHVILGLLVALYMIARAAQGAYLGEEDSGPVEHFGLYWHFVDIVWVFLFPIFYLM